MPTETWIVDGVKMKARAIVSKPTHYRIFAGDVYVGNVDTSRNGDPVCTVVGGAQGKVRRRFLRAIKPFLEDIRRKRDYTHKKIIAEKEKRLECILNALP